MDTELLKTFLEVCKTRHFGKAAENLYVTQAAVSSRIRQLESKMGLELFTRLRNNLQLTPAGEKLVPHAETVLISWQRAFQEVAIAPKQSVQLALGGSPNVWDLMLQNSIYELKISKPDLALRAEVLSQSVVARQLLERALDVALVFDAPKVEELVNIRLFQLPLELVATHPDLTIETLDKVGYIMLDWGTLFSMQHAKQCKDLPPPSLHTNIARVALDFMLQTGGSAYLPTQLVEPYIQQGTLYRIDNAPDMKRDVFACYHKDNDKKALIEEVIQLFEKAGSQVAPSLIPE